MLYLEFSPMFINAEQVREAIELLIDVDIADEIKYKVHTSDVIGEYKSWTISIKKEFDTVAVRDLIEFIKEQGYHNVYTNRYWRISA
jgi:hypothetical protein